ncbi:SDR family oxidoreductase [Hydrogenovibrio sp. SC-1]|uniref:SDR family NAD(P)-dependent oxidoreductase n=1 Tax=Hydrogenovibrio sp. SC-1 TaxID=2065820 RepID=UPI000C7B5494|nr:SDR family oxidoreductase [Hydrogenovibrio sp. SC-1]PLA75533.1 SDR family oxidoreductase [Hydrogenovibrio sp. SC-1]
MLISFRDQKVLVTGGSRGIGKQIALLFIESGCNQIVVTGQSKSIPDWITSFQKKSIEIQYHSMDLATTGWEDSFRKLVDEYDGFDVCVNNAGINSIHHLSEFPVDKIQEILKVNLQSPIIISGIVSKKMEKKQYGRIVNIASIFGVVSKEKRSAYTASKSGLIGVTKTMALDLASSKVLVNAVSPGFIETELTERVLGEEGIAEMKQRIPLNRLGKPQEIANYVLFLASDKNTYMTGQNITVDGGFVCE